MTRSSPPPLAVCLCVIALQTVAPAPPSSTRRRASSMTAAALAAGSAMVLAAPVVALRRRDTTIDPRPGAEPRVLVRTGVYRWSRNPMYLGMTGLLVSNAVRRRSAVAFVLAVAFATWADLHQIRTEERVLETTFGPEFAHYRASTRRWVGRPGLSLARALRANRGADWE